MASNRIGRINEELRKELSELLRNVKDPRVQGTMISVTRVEATPDLRYAKVYVSVLEKEKSKDDRKCDRSPRKQRDRDVSPQRNRGDRERSPKRRESIRDRLGPPQPELQPQYPPRQFTPLIASVSQVLYEIQNEKFLKWPSQMRLDPTKRDMTKYCDFHQEHGHHTDDCIQLKKEIEFLIRRGHLR